MILALYQIPCLQFTVIGAYGIVCERTFFFLKIIHREIFNLSFDYEGLV